MQNLIGKCYDDIEIIDVFTFPNTQEISVVWRCNKCGDSGIRTLQDLEDSIDKICFCNNPDRQQEYDNYIGKRFNELTIIDVIKLKNKKTIAMAACSCGALCRVHLSNVRNNHTKSCGHLKIDLINQQKDRTELIGKKFNRLTILDIYFDEEKKRQMAICKCDCGTIKTIRLDGVVSGHASSCGCYNKERSIEVNRGKRKLNEYTLSDNGIVSVLTASGERFLIDEISWKYLKNLTWCLSGNGYIITTSVHDYVFYLHHLLIDCPANTNYIRDHIDRNRLNNTYENLRVITYRGNLLNNPECLLHKNDKAGIQWQEKKSKWKITVSPEEYCKVTKTFTKLNEAIAWKKEQLDLHYNITELKTERLVLPSGEININYPFYKYPDILWEELKV